MVLPTMDNILIGMSFFKNYFIKLDLENNLVLFPDLSLQHWLKHDKFKCASFELGATQKVAVGPFQQVMVPTIAAKDLETSTGSLDATPSFSRKSDLNVTSALSQLQHVRTTTQVTNPNAHTFTISQGTIVADFKILTPGQASQVQPMSLEQLTLISSYPDEA